MPDFDEFVAMLKDGELDKIYDGLLNKEEQFSSLQDLSSFLIHRSVMISLSILRKYHVWLSEALPEASSNQ